MEYQFKLDNNGQSLQQADVNLLGKNAALAGDIALQEVLAMVPALSAGSVVDRGIVPLWSPGPVTGAGASGKVRVYPFLAVIGSRTDATTNQQAWKDIRTQIFTSEDVLGTLYHDYAIASNASGNPRWDLVYVTVSVDTDDAAVTRYVKTPPTTVAVATSVAVTKSTKLTLNTVQGTPAVSPTYPSLPADSGSNYNIPLCYVRVGNGANGTTVYGFDDIQETTSIVSLSHRTGVATCAPASCCFDPALPMLATRQPWPSASNRPRAYMPPSMQGKVERIIPFDLATSPATALNGDVLDDTIDWRKRVFKWTAQFRSSRKLAWDGDATTSSVVPNAGNDTRTISGMGQSFTLDDASDIPRGSIVASIGGTGTGTFSNNIHADLGTSAKLAIYVDQDTGELMLFQSGGPGLTWVFWIEATGQYYSTLEV